jgi:uncharacterized protein
VRSLDKQQLYDIMIGATLLGTGGGGSPKAATGLVDKTVAASPTVPMADLSEVADDANACVIAGMGSPIAALKRDISFEIVRAFEGLEKVVGEKIDYIVPIEIGGGNTTIPSLVAAHVGRSIVDADGAGRSIPELEMTTFAIFGVPISPLVIADPANNMAVVYAENPSVGEELGRAISTVFGSHSGIACHFMKGSKLKEVALAGTVSLAQRVGETIRKAKDSGADVTQAVLDITGGYLLARGDVTQMVAETRGGFDFGKVVVEDKQGEPLVIGTKNENMFAHRGGKLVAVVPDLICFLEESGMPLTNADVREGMKVSVIGIRCHDKWRLPEAVHVFDHALSQMGYEGGYTPIEELQGKQ